MNLFLAAVFAVLILSALVALAIWQFRIKVKSHYHYHLAAGINRFPGRLRLTKLEEFAWGKGGRAANRVAEFEAAGFVGLAGFEVDELRGARMFALRHPVTGLIGVVNEFPTPGTWSDVILFPADGSPPALASSILKRLHCHFLPGDPKIHKPDAPVSELVAAVISAVPVGAIANFDALDFAPRFEKAFADATDLRLLTPLEDYEIRRLVNDRVEICGGELTDSDLAGVKAMLPLAIANEFRLTCGSQFLRETNLTASEWQQATERLLVIHDRTPIPQLADKMIFGAYLTREMKRRLRTVQSQGRPRELFAAFNEALPAWFRYKKIGEVTRPVPADIFRAPMERG